MVSDSAPRPSRPRLGAALEAQRLDDRLRRMTLVVAELRERAGDYRARGAVPRPLEEAILGFGRQMRADRQRLRKLQVQHADPTSTRRRLARQSSSVGLLCADEVAHGHGDTVTG